MTFPVTGEPYALIYYVRSNGALVDLPSGSTVDTADLQQSAVTIQTITGPAVHTSTGTYVFPAATMPAAGAYDVIVHRTVNSSPQADPSGPLTVYAIDGSILTGIITTAEVRTHMSLTTAQVSDAELQHFIDAATVCIERWVGPVVQRTITETSYGNGGRSQLFLQGYPVISITSVTDGRRTDTPTALDATAYELDPMTSSLVRLDGRQFIDRTTVEFLAGRTVIGEHIRKAALNYVSNEVRRVKSLGTATFGEAGFVTAPAGLDNIVRNDLALDPYFRAAWVA